MYTLAVNWPDAFNVVAFGMIMVFILLIILVFVIELFGRILAPKVRIQKKTVKQSENSKTEPEPEYVEDHLPAVYGAAIAMALHLYYAEAHDEESHVITIKTVERRYSPWSSKIYGINNLVK